MAGFEKECIGSLGKLGREMIWQVSGADCSSSPFNIQLEHCLIGTQKRRGSYLTESGVKNKNVLLYSVF
jgi:hypothetical protein